MATLQSAREHYETQRQTTAQALTAARRLRFGDLGRLVAVVSAFQGAAALNGQRSVPRMLSEQSISIDQFVEVDARTLAGWTSYGLPLSDLLERVQHPSVDPFRFDRVIASQVQDAGRQGATLQMAATPSATYYDRVLNPPSCSRCVILAGKTYRNNEGFDRHPLCDCVHVPTDKANAEEHVFDGSAYFDSLSTEEQDRIFTKHGAELIRNADAADRQHVMGRVVNTRWMRHSTAAQDRRARLLPGDIVERAGGDRAELLRLMKRYRYIR